MKKIFILMCIFSVFAANAQNPGYFNRKNVLEFSVNGQMPVFANLKYFFNSDYFNKLKGNDFVQYRDRFDYGFRVAYMHTLKRNFGMGVEFGYDYFSIQRIDKSTSFNGMYYYQTAFENIDVSSMMIMPKLEFSNKGSVLPMGIAHQVGIGVRLVKPVDKTYHYKYIPNFGETSPAFNKVMEMPSYTGSAIKGMTFMYAVNMRTPLSKRLFLNYGLRYTLNFMSKSDYSEWTDADMYSVQLSESEFRNLARQRKQVSFIQANIGFSFAF